MFSWQKYWNPLQTLIKETFLVGHFFTRIYLRYPWLFATLDKGDEYDDGDEDDDVEDNHVLPSRHNKTPVLSIGALNRCLKNLFWHFGSEMMFTFLMMMMIASMHCIKMNIKGPFHSCLKSILAFFLVFLVFLCLTTTTCWIRIYSNNWSPEFSFLRHLKWQVINTIK